MDRGQRIRNSRQLAAEHGETWLHRYSNGETLDAIAMDYGVHGNTVAAAVRRLGGHIRKRGYGSGVNLSGPNNPQWRGGRIMKDGYVLVRMTPEMAWMQPMAAKGYVLEHRAAMAKHLGRLLEPHETVHHINGDKADNRVENLQLRQGRHGKGVHLACRDCGSRNVAPAPI